MISILLAQYVHATNHCSEGMSKTGKKLATLLFLGSNVVLTLVHLRFIGAPLFAKLQATVVATMNVARGEPPELVSGVDVVCIDNVDVEVDVEVDDFELTNRGVKALPSSTEAMIEIALEDNQLHVMTHDALETEPNPFKLEAFSSLAPNYTKRLSQH